MNYEDALDIIESEIARMMRHSIVYECLQDRSLTREDIKQGLRLHAYIIFEKFDQTRYEDIEQCQKAYRLYVRKSFHRYMIKMKRRIRVSLPLQEWAVVSDGLHNIMEEEDGELSV